MSEQEKLIYLLKNAPADYERTRNEEIIAEYLLSNGVIVLPCKVGDTVYVIQGCKCGSVESYELKCCYKKETVRSPKVLARVMQQNNVKQCIPVYRWKTREEPEFTIEPIGTRCYNVLKRQFTLEMLTKIGKTVFLTLEDAEKALQEKERRINV